MRVGKHHRVCPMSIGAQASVSVLQSLCSLLKSPARLTALLWVPDTPLTLVHKSPLSTAEHLSAPRPAQEMNVPPTERALLGLCWYQPFLGAGRRNLGSWEVSPSSGVFLRTCLYFHMGSACLANLAIPLKAQGPETCGVPLLFRRVPTWYHS